MLLLLVVFAAGCKKVTEQPGLIGVCPKVISTNPVDKAVGIMINAKIGATFNETMTPSSINTTTFTIQQGSTSIPGVVTYSGTTATFSPSNNLALNTTYTGTITTSAKDSAGNAPASDYVWTFTTGSSSDITPPTVTSTDPINAATAVVLNKKIAATFSKAMNPSTISATTFVLKQGTTAVLGSVTYSGTTAIFSPSANLISNTTYIATITTGAHDIAGNTLVNDYSWTFTTGSSSDITPPTVISTDPNNADAGVDLNKIIAATFSEAMTPLSIDTTTFILKQGTTAVLGAVTYAGTTATFSPSVNLVPYTTYTATITTGAKDLVGNAMVNDYVWSFTTGGQTIISPFLGSASNFGALGGNAGVTNQGLHTMINNGGISTTAASTLVTGFHDGLTAAVYTETPLNVGDATGGIYTAPPAPGTSTSFSVAKKALADATIAYNSMSPASKPGGIDPGADELGGLTLAPGVYKSASGTFKITNLDLVLDAKGDPNATWVFQTAAGLTVGTPTGARSITMINGGLAKNVFWYVGSQAVINYAGGGTMVGTIIAYAGVTLSSPANSTTTTAKTVLNGRALSLVASVTMVNTIINVQ